MIWTIGFSRDADKFLARNHMEAEAIFELIKLAVRKFRGETVNLNIRKLKGVWQGYYRIRRGDLRIIASFNFDHNAALVEVIDWRGSVYKD